MPKAMKILDAKKAVDKEWKHLETIPWQTERKSTLMGVCHLKKELESELKKYKGRVVLRGDIVKEDSGSYAVFTEQVS